MTPSGIYSNPLAQGREWERPVSMELIDPIGGSLLEVEAGLRLMGGTSRDPAVTPKHSFRLYFKNEYGPSILDAPLFDGHGRQRFDRLTLLAGLQDGWLQPDPESRSKGLLIRDQWVRQTMVEMGHPAARGRFVHLYLNGQYWGIYNLAEDIDDAYAAIQFGGSKSDYDVMDAGQLDSGESSCWQAVIDLAAAGLQDPAAYEQIQQYVDLQNFMDFALVRMFVGDREWKGGNWYAIRNRIRDEPFRFFTWDSERVLGESETDVLPPTDDSPDSVLLLWHALQENPAFRRAFADRVQLHLRDGGLLTPDRNMARWDLYAKPLSAAIVAESARWGDYRKDGQPVGEGPHELYTADDHWQIEADRVRDAFLPQRTEHVLAVLRDAGLYPAIEPPVLDQMGGTLTEDFALHVTAEQGEIFYTLDGLDPAAADGSVADTAIRYETAIELAQDTIVQARVRVAGQWSALVSATFYRPSTLRISEIHYHAAPSR